MSREMLLTALQRYAAAHTAETTTSTVDIPSDDMKGRIIGREGRNIRAFEKATGVDVIIDDTPGVVIVSGFDPVRREVARLALNKLIADGRIHPSRIEEIVAETQKEIGTIHPASKGEEAAQEVERPRPARAAGLPAGPAALPHQLQPERAAALDRGRLRGRHAGREIGLNGDVARRCGLLHDIGKAADHEVEGGHPKIGADLLKRLRRAARGRPRGARPSRRHRHRLSLHGAGRRGRRVQRLAPGARRETLERYIKRMEELESIATGFPGVEQAFAIQAGRELRVMVSAKDTDDVRAAKICRDIAKAFEEQLTYPGEIKVTVIRESRFTEMAR